MKKEKFPKILVQFSLVLMVLCFWLLLMFILLPQTNDPNMKLFVGIVGSIGVGATYLFISSLINQNEEEVK